MCKHKYFNFLFPFFNLNFYIFIFFDFKNLRKKFKKYTILIEFLLYLIFLVDILFYF